MSEKVVWTKYTRRVKFTRLCVLLSLFFPSRNTHHYIANVGALPVLVPGGFYMGYKVFVTCRGCSAFGIHLQTNPRVSFLQSRL